MAEVAFVCIAVERCLRSNVGGESLRSPRAFNAPSDGNGRRDDKRMYGSSHMVTGDTVAGARLDVKRDSGRDFEGFRAEGALERGFIVDFGLIMLQKG